MYRRFLNLSKYLVIVLFFLSGLLFSHEKPVEQKQDFKIYKEAKKAIYEKEWQKASGLLESIKSTFPNSNYIDDSIYWLAYTLHKSSENIPNKGKQMILKRESLRNLNILIKSYGKSDWVDDAKILRIKVSLGLVKSGQVESRKYILRAAKSTRESEKELKMVALDALYQVDKEKAIPMLEKVLKEDPDEDMWEKALLIMQRSSKKEKTGSKNEEPIFLSQRQKPDPLREVKAEYPKVAVSARIQGKVILKVTIDKKGNVINVTLFSGHPLLNSTAIKTVKQYKYTPYIVNGRPVPVTFYERVDFILR